jgi:hypothetical protein
MPGWEGPRRFVGVLPRFRAAQPIVLAASERANGMALLQ